VIAWAHRALLALAVGLALVTALRTATVLYGDAREYLLMSESLANHASPDLRPEDVASFDGLCRRAGIAEPVESRLIGYYEAANGGRYSYHFWAYSLAVVPVKLVLRALGADELRAAQVLNALLMGGLLAFVAWRAPLDETRKLLLNGLLFFSPAAWFILWPHPEVFSFALTAAALVLRLRRTFRAAILCTALAALQNPQLMLLAALLWLEAVVRLRIRLRPVFALRASARWRDAVGHTLPALPFLLHPLFFYARFGVMSVVAREATSLAKLSPSRAWDLVFDLNLGLLPYVPLAVLLYFLVVARAAWTDRSQGSPVVRLFFVFVALLLVNTLQWNFNHGSSGPSRYVVWMMPILFVTLAAEMTGRAFLAALGLAVAVQAGIVASRGGLIPRYDYLQHSPVAAYVLDRWPRLYDPDYEVFIKRTLHVEGPTHGPYAYLARGRCRKVLANRTHEAAVRQICGDIPQKHLSFFRAEDGSRRAERAWSYVDY
jgi:hypothetical protein